MNKKTLSIIVCCLLAFALPFALFYFTHSDSLGFADAAEFALVTKIASVAHGPGFPSYVLLGWLWSVATGIFLDSHLLSIILFSLISMSLACMLMYLTIYRLFSRIYPNHKDLYLHLIALGTSLAFASGLTVWYWAGNVEVYAFHVFAFALAVFGTLGYHHSRKTFDLLIAGIGLALGMANHHLTMILFIPFMLPFLGADMFAERVASKPVGKSKKTKGIKNGPTVLSFFGTKHFRIFSGTVISITLLFYGWMVWRATVPLPFKFGSPDTLDRFFFHVTGGAWMKHTTEQVEGIFGMRLPYFAWLISHQYSLFLLLIVAGFAGLIARKWYRFALLVIGYFALLLFYQLRLNQIGDSDAYILLPFYFLAFAIPFGAIWLMQRRKELLLVIPLFLIAQVLWNFPLADKRKFDLSESLMKMLDKSSPKNSVILVSDWTTVSEYFYYRIAENFRPDLVVLNYDIKFTNHTMLPVMYPDYYKMIKPEYDAFVAALGKEHPQQIYNTGCELGTPDLDRTYTNLIHKISSVSAETKRPLLIDPKAFVYLTQNKIIPEQVFLSGCFVSQSRTDMGADFIKLPFHWLDMEIVKHEPSAGDKLVDLQAMLDFHKIYYTSIHDSASLSIDLAAHEKIINLQAEMKENIPYIFRKTD